MESTFCCPCMGAFHIYSTVELVIPRCLLRAQKSVRFPQPVIVLYSYQFLLSDLKAFVTYPLFHKKSLSWETGKFQRKISLVKCPPGNVGVSSEPLEKSYASSKRDGTCWRLKQQLVVVLLGTLHEDEYRGTN